MATNGTNNTVKWNLSNGVLTISPVSGNSGIAYNEKATQSFGSGHLADFITLTDDERNSITKIVFSGDISLYRRSTFTRPYNYVKVEDLSDFLIYHGSSYLGGGETFPNLLSIDISGLNTSGVEKLNNFFDKGLLLDGVVEIIGLSSLDLSSATSLVAMFRGTLLDALDISNFPLNGVDDFYHMIRDMPYCTTVTFPDNFSRIDAGASDYETLKYNIGLASSDVPATKDGVTITSDEDFFKLDSAQGGTWTRDISGMATLKFKITSTERDGSTATFNYSYATTEATASVYMKESTSSSYPSTPQDTFTIAGTGTGTYSATLATDNSYDFKIIVSDGTTSLYLFPSVDSNVLLVSVDDDGNVAVSGDGEIAGDLIVNGDGTINGGATVGGDIVRKTEWDGSSIPSSNLSYLYKIMDASQREIGQVITKVWSVAYGVRDAGAVSTILLAKHPTANVENSLQVLVNPDGTKEYTVSDPSRFRAAIGIPVAVVGTGSSNGWVWRKYSDKTFDAWYSGTATTAINSAVGSLYQSGSNLSLSIPSGIGATSVLYGDVNLITASYGVWTYIITLNSTTFSYRGMSALSRASASYTVKAYVRGTYS